MPLQLQALVQHFSVECRHRGEVGLIVVDRSSHSQLWTHDHMPHARTGHTWTDSTPKASEPQDAFGATRRCRRLLLFFLELYDDTDDGLAPSGTGRRRLLWLSVLALIAGSVDGMELVDATAAAGRPLARFGSPAEEPPHRTRPHLSVDPLPRQPAKLGSVRQGQRAVCRKNRRSLCFDVDSTMS